MAASVESVFILVDRASGTIRQIRRELRDLESDARKAGLAMDSLSGPRAARQMEAQARQERAVRQEADQMGQSFRRAEQDAQRLETRSKGLENQARKTKVEFSALGKVFSLLRWPAMIAGAGGLLQVLGALTGGAIALLPKILDLAGAGTAFGSVAVGAAGAMGVWKLATSDLSKALNGNKNAIKALTPEGRAFLQVLKDMHPAIQQLRSTAQRGIFPGVGGLLQTLQGQRAGINSIVGQISGDVGNLGGFLGKQIQAPGFMRDLASLANQGSRSFGAAAQGGFFFAKAIEQVILAAQPLTDWLGATFVQLGKTAAQEAEVARATGQMGTFFDRTKQSIKTMWDIGKNALGGLRGVLAAARGEGDSLWLSVDRVAKRFNDWANSSTGQGRMRAWFEQMRPVLHETVGLFGDLARGIGSLTQGQAGAAMLEALRRAVPSLVSGIRSLVTNLGPAVAQSFGAVVRLFGDLAGQSGPLTLVARAIGTVATAVDRLVRALGPVGNALGTALLSFGLMRKLGVFSAVDTLRAKWLGVGVAAADAAVAERAAAMGGVPIGGAGGRGGILPIPGAGGAAGGLSTAAGAELGATGVGGAAALSYLRGRGAIGAEEAFAARYGGIEGARFGAPVLAAGSGEAGLLSRGASAIGGVASRFLAPIAAIQYALGLISTPGGIGNRLQGGASSLTFGLLPAPQSGSQIAQQAASGIAPQVNLPYGSVGQQRQSIAGIQGRLQQLQTHPGHAGGVLGALSTLPGFLGGGSVRDDYMKKIRAETAGLQAELRRRRQILAQSQQQEQQSLDATSVRNAQYLSGQFAQAFNVLKGPKGPQRAMKETVDNVLARMRQMRPAGAKVLDQSMLDWARQQARNNPKLWGQYNRLVAGIKGDFSDLHRHIQIVNGLILDGSQKEWQQIGTALTSPVEKAREEVTKGFTDIQQKAVGSLTAMGYTPAQARGLVRSFEQGITTPGQVKTDPSLSIQHLTDVGKHSASMRATGGRTGGYRLPGTGTVDSVAMADGGYGAPGELVLNQHTERDVNRDLSMAGRPLLDQRVRSETRKHSTPAGVGAGYSLGGVIAAAGNAAAGRSAGGVAALHPELHAGIAQAVQAVLSHFPGLSITSTTGGGHAAGSYHYCVPMDTEILTQDGWKDFDDIQPGDLTVGFNPATSRAEWTPILEKLQFDDAEMIEASNSRTSIEMTPNHRWLVEERPWLYSRDRSRCRERAEYQPILVPFDRIPDSARMRVAASTNSEHQLDLTIEEVEIIAWALTDGWICRTMAREGRGNVDGRERVPRATIRLYQKKPEGVAMIDTMLRAVPHRKYVHNSAGVLGWYIPTAVSTDILKRSRLDELGPVGFVLALGPAERERFLAICRMAEGSKADGFLFIAQNDGEVKDAIAIAAALCGYFTCERADGIGLRRPHIERGKLRVRSVGKKTVWCVRTELGTWTMRQRGQILLTGNSGEAADISGGSGLMFQAAQWINQNLASGLAEGIHNPNLSVKSGHGVPSSFWGPAVWAEHANHIHMAVAGALQAGGLLGGGGAQLGLSQIAPLHAPGTRLRGVPGALVTRAGTIYAKALTDKVNQSIGGAGSFAGVPGAGGDANANRALGRAMMLTRWGPDQWPYLDLLWTKESGWNASARNPGSGAAGIVQDITGNFHGGARGQIGWGLNYLAQRYGSPQAAWAHEQQFNWYGKGADMIVRRPTVFGAGEAGPERVQITPAGRGHGAVNIARGAVQINTAGGSQHALQRYVDRRLEQFARQVADEIESGAELSHHGAIG